jgi:hypothetical protein
MPTHLQQNEKSPKYEGVVSKVGVQLQTVCSEGRPADLLLVNLKGITIRHLELDIKEGWLR